MSKKQRMWLAILVGVVVPITVAIIAKIRCDNPPPLPPVPKGEIASYVINDEEITIEGTLNNIPTNSYIWVAIQIDNNLWPKELNIPISNSKWRGIIFGIPKEEFAIVLLMVGSEGNVYIKSWVEECKANNDWPGIEQSLIPGIKVLDIKTVPSNR